MKWFLSFVGIVLVLLGSLWILQCLNILTRGFMAGHIEYAILGAVVALGGIGLVLFANLRGKRAPAAR